VFITRAILNYRRKALKFLCNTEFIHSNVKTYNAGVVYVITAEMAEQLIALDKNKPLGALSYFAPIDEEAVNFIKEKKGNEPEKKSEENPDPAVKQPTKAELINEAKELGIKATNFMSIEQLNEVIAAAKKAQQA